MLMRTKRNLNTTMTNAKKIILFKISGTMIPKSGGDYAYIGVAFGPLPAFLYLWVALLILVPTGNAITALTFAQYLLQPFWPTCDAPLEAVRLLAAIITCKLFFFLHIMQQCAMLSPESMNFLRSSHGYQLLQRQMGHTCDRHIHRHQNFSIAAHCCHGLLVAIQRQYREIRRTIQWITCISWIHCVSILQWPFLIFRMELFEFCHGRIKRSISVSANK